MKTSSLKLPIAVQWILKKKTPQRLEKLAKKIYQLEKVLSQKRNLAKNNKLWLTDYNKVYKYLFVNFNLTFVCKFIYIAYPLPNGKGLLPLCHLWWEFPRSVVLNCHMLLWRRPAFEWTSPFFGIRCKLILNLVTIQISYWVIFLMKFIMKLWHYVLQDLLNTHRVNNLFLIN